jgi:hypothetical protein
METSTKNSNQMKQGQAQVAQVNKQTRDEIIYLSFN